MRKFYYVASLFALMLTWACSKDSYDDSKLWEKVNSLDYRVTNLESTVSQFNSDIRSISDIVNALKNNVFVTSVVETSEGQKITFSDGKSIVIKNGKDGKDGVDGNSPFIGSNGNWWIGTTDTGVKAKGTDGRNGTDGLTPVIGANGNWWIGTTDTGVKAAGTNGKDGETPHIGSNGNWWIGTTDTGVKAAGTNGTNGKDGFTPHIGPNGNWWIGQQDTGVAASGGSGGGSTAVDVPIISIKEDGGVYYWVQILNGVTTWLTDKEGNRLPVSGKDGKDGVNGTNGTNGITPLLRIDSQGYWQVSYDGGKSYTYVTNEYGQRVSATSGAGGECNCKQFFRDVYFKDGRLYLILIDGSVFYFEFASDEGNVTPKLPIAPNIVIPNPKFVVVYEPGRGYVLRIYMLGFKHPTKEQWLTYSDGADGNSRNTWIDIDGKGQVIDIYKPNNEGNKTMPTDLTFLVDNSGSMGEEADVLARDIISWSQQLSNKGIDIRFGVVGYSESGTINGALDFTTASYLNAYLNYEGRTGTARTTGFAAQNSIVQQTMINNSNNYTVTGECGGMALRYADANLSFRTNSYRVYVNFTDEPNQPNKKKEYSVSWFTNNSNWSTEKGVIHTIYSASDSFAETQYERENYKPLSRATGGEYITAKNDFSDIDLNNLPVTKAIEDSQIIDIYGISNDGSTHDVRVTFISADNTVVGQNTYSVKFSVN